MGYKYDAAAMVARCMRGQQPDLFVEGYITQGGWMPSMAEVTGRGDPLPPSEIHLPPTDTGRDDVIPIDSRQDVMVGSSASDPASFDPTGVFYD